MRDSATAYAPGRVNLIGEHTDYNDGFTLPLAIAFGCTATVRRLEEPIWRAASAQVSQPWQSAAGGSLQDAPAWVAYVLGALALLHERGVVDADGVEVTIDSDVPLGAGLSSSAAVVCAVVTALDTAYDLDLGPGESLALSRAVENDVVGAPTGGMDQLVSLRAVAGHALMCDMADLTATPVPFDPQAHGLSLLVVDSHSPHTHAEGEYAARREGCEAAAAALGVPSLRALTDSGAVGERLEAMLAPLPDEQRRLVRHVVTENDRVLRTAAALRAGEMEAVGSLLTSSHVSMRDDFRITVDRIDVAVEALLAAGALGARMTGGGFGGCVIALVGEDAVAPTLRAVEEAYAARGWQRPTGFVATAQPGARALQ